MKKDNNILAELAEIAPLLSKLPRKNPFKVPQNYFESNIESIDAVAFGKETALSPQLSGIKKDFYKIPENYFQQNESISVAICSNTEPVLSNKLKSIEFKGYKVPKNYFENSIPVLLNVCLDREPELSATLKAVKFDGYKVPENYFENSIPVLLNVCLDREPELSATLKAAKFDGYKVPENYFTDFALRISEKVQSLNEVDANLKYLRDDESLNVPDGYFSNLSSRIMNRVKEEEAEQSDLLSSISNKEQFVVPANYFETFPGKLMDRIRKEEDSGKVIQMNPSSSVDNSSKDNVFSINKKLMSVAAILLMFLLGTFLFNGGLFDNDNQNQLAFNIENELSELSDLELSQFLNIDEMDEYNLIENMSQDIDMMNFVNDRDLEGIKNNLLDEIDLETLNDYI